MSKNALHKIRKTFSLMLAMVMMVVMVPMTVFAAQSTVTKSVAFVTGNDTITLTITNGGKFVSTLALADLTLVPDSSGAVLSGSNVAISTDGKTATITLGVAATGADTGSATIEVAVAGFTSDADVEDANITAAASTAVAVTNAIEDSTKNKINVTLDVGVTALVLADFTVTKAGVPYTDFAVDETDSTHYILIMTDAANNGDVFTVTIAKTGYTFTGTSVTNNVAPASTAVVVTNAIADATKNNIDVTLDVGVTGLALADFTVTKAGAPYTDFAVDETDSTHYILIMTDAANNGDVFTVTIAKTGYTFTGTSVTNNVAPASTAVVVTNAIADATKNNIDVTLDVGVTGLALADFTVTKAGAPYTDFTLTGMDPTHYILIMTDAAANGDVFTVTIAKTGYTFTGTSVTNNVAPASTAVVVTNSIADATKNNIDVTLDVGVTGLALADFTVTKAGSPYTDFILTETDSTHFILAMTDAAIFGDVFTVTITKSGHTFTGTSVTINIASPYTLTIGNETPGGAGRYRTITIGGGNTTGKWLVIKTTEGTGTAAKVAVIMTKLTGANETTVSYQTAGTDVEVWLVSGMPDLVAAVLDVDQYAHAITTP